MRFLLPLLLLLSFTLPVSAQEHPKAELFGGYSYLRTDAEEIDLNQVGVPARVRQ